MAYGCCEAGLYILVPAGEGAGKDGCEAGEVIQTRVDFIAQCFLDVAEDANPGIVVGNFVLILWRRSRSSVVLVS